MEDLSDFLPAHEFYLRNIKTANELYLRNIKMKIANENKMAKMKMNQYIVQLSDIEIGEIETPEEATIRFCLKYGIDYLNLDGVVFRVQNSDTNNRFDVEWAEGECETRKLGDE